MVNSVWSLTSLAYVTIVLILKNSRTKLIRYPFSALKDSSHEYCAVVFDDFLWLGHRCYWRVLSDWE